MADEKEEEEGEEEGDSKSPSEALTLDEAKKVVTEMQAANKERKELIEREEELHAQKILSGKADAGEKKEKTKEDKAIESAKNLIKGSGFENDLFPETQTG